MAVWEPLCGKSVGTAVCPLEGGFGVEHPGDAEMAVLPGELDQDG